MKNNLICWLYGHPLKHIYWDYKDYQFYDMCECGRKKVLRGTNVKYFIKP